MSIFFCSIRNEAGDESATRFGDTLICFVAVQRRSYATQQQWHWRSFATDRRACSCVLFAEKCQH